VVQPAENWAAKNLPGPFDGTRERRILLQGAMCAGAITIFHVRQQQVAEIRAAIRGRVVGDIDDQVPAVQLTDLRASLDPLICRARHQRFKARVLEHPRLFQPIVLWLR
jgi:hypothetical protein